MIGHWPIRIQLAALVGAVGLPLIGFGAITTWQDFAESRRGAEAQAEAFAVAVSAGTARFLSTAESLAARLAADPGTRRLDPARCPDDWPAAIHGHRVFINVATVDLRGRFICSAPAPILPTSQRATTQRSPWFRDFSATPGWVVGDVQLGGLTHRNVSVLGSPIRDETGAIVAALTLTVDVCRFREPWYGLPLPAGAVVTLVDGTGVVVTRSVGAGHWVGRLVAPSALVNAVRLRADTVFDGVGLDRVRRVFGAAPIPHTTWTAVVGISMSEALAGARRGALRTLGLAVVILPLAVVLAFATSRAIVRPLEDLGATLRIPGARPIDRVPESGPPELRALIAAYNGMIARSEAAERDAGAERQRMHAVASLAPVGIFHVSAEGRALFVNDEMLRITGLTKLSGPRDLRQSLHPADRERITTAWTNAMRNGSPFRAEFRFRRADGSVIWAQGQAVPEHDDDGNVIGMIGTLVDITDQVRTATDLNVAYARVRSLLAQLESAREQERSRIARELHDQLGQLFVALRMDLGSLERSDALSDSARERIAAMRMVVDRGVQDTRRLSRELRPSVLDDLGLIPALRWLADDFSQRSGVACEVRLPGEPMVADPDRATAVFRIIQEALTNIARHAAASQVLLVLENDQGMLAATVTDDGAGFDPVTAATHVSYGLLGMQERAAAFGGHVAVWSSPGHGTTVAMEIPATSARGA